MAAVATYRPFSQTLATLSASSQLEAPQTAEGQRPARSHYRPHSTLYLDEDAVLTRRDSVLAKSRRHSTLLFSASVGAAMGLGMKKNSNKDKGKVKEKAREKAKELPKLRIRKLSDNTTLVTQPEPSPSWSTKSMSRPTTSSGETVAERSSISGKSMPHRLKAQRSMASLFSAAVPPSDVSPNIALSESNSRSKSGAISSSLLSTSRMDVDRLPLTPTSARSTRSATVGGEDDLDYKQKEYRIDNNVWLTRSNTKVHPYIGEAPYMQAYDTTCLDNDRYSELLLQRLNPGSPSFHDYGKKPPLTALDMGCGQGHWVLWAASMWKNSRITGFDIVDITLPAPENVNFVRGNFLFKLPFPAKSFEYVRMSNLSLCIPYNQWEPLLQEVRRVLTLGGRLELIDDQIFFPYGEEPNSKDVHPSETSNRNAFSFVNFDNESDSGDDDTLEEAASTSTASTLVSEFDLNSFPDKQPSSKRSSSQSNPAVSIVEPIIPLFSRDKPLPIPNETHPLSPLIDNIPVAISPSPTITQGSVNSLDNEPVLSASATITQHSPIQEHKRHRKTGSASSTKSNTEAISAWKRTKNLSLDMESIFEYLLLNKCGIHPRPAEFIQDTMRHIFGKGNAGKVRSFHIKLAPFDSPIGPGGALAPRLPTTESPLRLEKEPKPSISSSDQLKRHWKQISDKKDKKEREKQEKKLARERARSTSSRASFDDSYQLPVITAKAASRLGVVPTVPSLPPKRISAELSTSSDCSSSSGESVGSSYHSSIVSNSSKPLLAVTDKAADRLGISSIPPPVPPKPILASRSSDTAMQMARPSPRRGMTSPGISEKAAGRLGIPISRPMSRSVSAGVPPLTPISYPPGSSDGHSSLRAKSSSVSMSRTTSCGSNQSSSELFSNNAPISTGPPALSAKAAGRLGISYSVLAAAAAVHSRSSGVMAPVQSPGLLVWPSTYIQMSPTELEMHSCKYIQTLLGCRHALHEHITSDFGGNTLATDEDFDNAIWEYECFRRSRFHWPNDNPELYLEQGFPEPPSPTALSPPRGLVRQNSGKPTHSRNASLESYNGQYRREELTHIRTIRVFEAVKGLDEKTFVGMLFSGSPKTPSVPSYP